MLCCVAHDSRIYETDNMAEFLKQIYQLAFSRYFGDNRTPAPSSPAGRRSASMIPDDLEAIRREIQAVVDEDEDRFLHLGKDLQELFSEADQLSRLAIDTARTMGRGGDGGFLANIDGLVKGSLGLLKKHHEGIGASLENVSTSFSYLGKLCALCPKIQKTGMSLNVIGLNIAVESSRSQESVEMFIAFTEEIRLLSRKIAGISENIMEDSSRSRGLQAQTDEEIHQGLDDYAILYDNAEKLVQDAVNKISGIMDLSVNALERLNSRGQEISRQVGEVVVAIQIHDKTCQQTEKIISEIQEARTQLAERGGTRRERISRAHTVLCRQEKRLERLIEDIRRAHHNTSTAFANIGDLLQALSMDAAVLDDSGRQGVLSSQHIDALRAGLEQLRDLLGRSGRLESRIRETTTQVTEAASRLSIHIEKIRSISLDLHLKALNAIVKSARLQAEGRVLEVLAQEVSKLSYQSDQFVADVVAILELLVELSRKMGTQKRENETDRRQEDIRQGIDEITRHYDQFREKSDQVLNRSRILRSKVEGIGENLTFLLKMAGRLENLGARLMGHRRELEATLSSEDLRSVRNAAAMADNDFQPGETGQAEETYPERPHPGSVPSGLASSLASDADMDDFLFDTKPDEDESFAPAGPHQNDANPGDIAAGETEKAAPWKFPEDDGKDGDEDDLASGISSLWNDEDSSDADSSDGDSSDGDSSDGDSSDGDSSDGDSSDADRLSAGKLQKPGEEKAAPTSDTAPGVKEDLGDNVELF